MSEVTWRRGNSRQDSFMFWARSKHAALMLTVFLLPFLWNSLIFAYRSFGEYGERREGNYYGFK
jgi:hypothetical protein